MIKMNNNYRITKIIMNNKKSRESRKENCQWILVEKESNI